MPADPLTVARFLTDLAPHWRAATPPTAGHPGRTTDEGLLVHLRWSKTDQAGAGCTVAITGTTSAGPLDAVTALVRWRNASPPTPSTPAPPAERSTATAIDPDRPG
jgi:hypothetical protein